MLIRHVATGATRRIPDAALPYFPGWEPVKDTEAAPAAEADQEAAPAARRNKKEK